MNRPPKKPLCEVGDLVRYDWGELGLFFVFGRRWVRMTNCYQYNCYCFETGDVIVFEFVFGPPEVLS